MARIKNIQDAEVLEKALIVISELGPDTFSLADVGEATGLAPSTLLQRFGSKRDLLVLAAKHANIKLQKDLEELSEKKISWRKELEALFCAVPEGFGSRKDIANSLGLLKLDIVDPELHPIAKKLFKTLRDRIYILLSEANSKKSVDVEAMVWEIDALRHGLVIQWTLSGTGTIQNWLKKGLNNYLNRRLK